MNYPLPQDPAMLMSLINMKLRDSYSSLDELCDDMDISREELIKRLEEVGFEYSEENRRFF
ncbi:MAG: DUF4250 domain-containing protein [Paramuribaculum sp.]|nr:DUF4250 domain-containing protein [Paramuribaculum sp.]